MNRLQAFKQTVKKWEWMIEHSPNNWSQNGCPIDCGFCEYADSFLMDSCEPCPIYKMTGLRGCGDTPFHSKKQTIRTALLEYDFLHHVAYATGILKV